MAKNLIPEICKLLGVEVGERFKIRIKNADVINPTTYAILNSGTLCYYQTDDVLATSTTLTIQHLLNGYAEVIKLPWKPKEHESFWSFYLLPVRKTLIAARMLWNSENVSHLVFYKEGWVYRTREEAETALQKVAEELGVKYEIGI